MGENINAKVKEIAENVIKKYKMESLMHKYEEEAKEYYSEEGLENLLQAIQEEPDDNVIHPSHYNMGKFEVWDVIEDWNLDFFLGNVIKYIARAGHKNDKLEDLKKAQNYLEEYIERLEAKIESEITIALEDATNKKEIDQ